MAKTQTHLRFVGPQHYREISKADWEAVGITDQDAIRVAGENSFVRLNDRDTPQAVTLSQKAAAFLQETEGTLWEECDKAIVGKSPTEVHMHLAKQSESDDEDSDEDDSDEDSDDDESDGDPSDQTGDGTPADNSANPGAAGGDSTARTGAARAGARTASGARGRAR